VCWSVDEESVDGYTICIKILCISFVFLLKDGQLTPKVVRAACLVELDPGGSSLSVTKNTLLFPFILDPLIVSLTSKAWNLRITKDEITSNQYFSNIQFLILPTRRERLS
jgi:hypothetical protein